jgi:GH15 family glucan-1,4-alpha-glucosidase
MSAKNKTGYKKAIELLKQCSCEHGFYASLEKKANYKRIWSRDGVIMGLAALVAEDKKLIQTFRNNLDTLLRYQGRQGEIPSNVSPESEKVSYGRLAGRVDASLWYVIGCGKYYQHNKDESFLDKHYPGVCKTVSLLECWEFNEKDFIFVPESGDWADEMPRRGYLLYDQVLYFLALGEFVKIKRARKESYKYWEEKRKRLGRKIEVNFWPNKVCARDQKYIYHKPTHKGLWGKHDFWLEAFSSGSERFDALGNILAIISGFSTKAQNKKIVEYISRTFQDGLVPAFHPIIFQEDEEWRRLQANYSFEFKNKPYLSQNGGLWPLVNGFYVMALRQMGEEELADNYLEKITKANYLHKQANEKWGFYEYLHGKNNTPEGVSNMGWSAASQILAFKSNKIL